MKDCKKITDAIIEGKEIRQAISEGYFSELVIELGDEINDKLEKLRAEDPLYSDTEQKSYAQNKKDLEDFVKKLEGYGVNATELVKNLTQGKQDIRWAEVWNGLLDNLTK